MRDITKKKHCIIVCNETEKEYSNLSLSRSCRILKSIAEEEEMGIDKIFRLPAFDRDASEKKWIDIIDFYKKSNRIHKIYVDSLDKINQLNPRFSSVLITFIVDSITNENLEVYNNETCITLKRESKKEHWAPFLGKKHINKVEEVAVSNEFKDTVIETMDKMINWNVDILFINSVRISQEFSELFPTPDRWTKDLCRKFGGIDNVLDFFKVKHPNIKLYLAKEKSLRAWNMVLSMHDMETTKEIIEYKYRCKFDMKRKRI